MPQVLKFLDRLAVKENLAANAVKGYLTAIAKRHIRVREGDLTKPITEL